MHIGSAALRLEKPVWQWSLWPIGLFSLIALVCSFGATAEDTVCARVKIEIRQELTLERQGFDAEMKINNTTDSGVIENVAVTVKVTDENGTPVAVSDDPNDLSAKFFVRLSGKDNIAAADGSGSVAAKTTATLDWLLIPAPGAASDNPFGKKYLVGATLRYRFGGEDTVLEVSPDVITVKPLPLLTLDYFLPRDVWADDPLTAAVEAIEPFTLGVRVKNTGHATAKNLAIDSAQPKIIENNQGLLINFTLTGSFVNDNPVQNSLLIDFGDIPAATSKMGRWNMETTLAGKFTEFTARFSHSDELGGALTALLQATNTHTLIHDVRVDLPGRDAVRDFLANDGAVLRVYESEGTDTEVTDRSSVASFTPAGADASGRASYRLSFPPTAGFVYIQRPDPFGGQKTLAALLRSDAKALAAPNIWLSKTRNAQTKAWEYWVNFFDVNSTGGYDVAFQDPAGTDQPPVIQFIPDRIVQEGKQVSFLVEASSPSGRPVGLVATPLPTGSSFAAENSAPQGLSRSIFDWKPGQGTAGNYRLVYTASDGRLSTTRSAIIRVDAANLDRAPPAAHNDHAATRKSVKLTVPILANDALGLGVAGFNPATLDLDTTTPTVDPTRSLPGIGRFTANLDGSVRFEPLASFTGVATLTYRVQDSLARATNFANLDVTVTGPGNPSGDTTLTEPLANPDDASVPVDTPVRLAPTINDIASPDATLELASLDLDPSVEGIQTVKQQTEGAWQSHDDGTVDFTPASGFAGKVTLAYAIGDSSGKTASSTLTLIVTGGAVPIAQDDRGATAPATAVILAILDNDSPSAGYRLVPGSVDLDATTPNQVDPAVTTPEGLWTADPSGTVTFTPSADYQGLGKPFTGTTAPLAYLVTDGNGLSAGATVAITVNPTAPPTAAADSANAPFGSPVTLIPAGNDTASAGATLNPSTLDLIASTPAVDQTRSGSEGVWTVTAEGSVRFNPEASFTGATPPLTYLIRDSYGRSATAALSVTVATPGSLSLSGTVFHDLDGDALRAATEPGTRAGGLYVSALTNGIGQATAPVNPDGSYQLPVTANTDYVLVLSTTANSATASLPALWSRTGESAAGAPDGTPDGRLTLRVGVVSLADLNFGLLGASPVANADRATTAHATLVSSAVLDNDLQGPDGTRFDPTSIDLNPSAAGVQASLTTFGEGTYSVDPVTGHIQFQPLVTFSGSATPIHYQVADDLGRRSNAASYTVVVGPDAIDQNAATPFTTALNGSVATGAVYSVGAIFTKTSEPAHGQVTLSTDGRYTYMPATGYSGADRFGYTLCLPSPDASLCDAASVLLTVAAPLVAPELRVQLTTSSDQPSVGLPFIYTVNLTNLGGATTAPVQIISNLPSGIKLVAVQSDTGWTCTPRVTAAQTLQGGASIKFTCNHPQAVLAGTQSIRLTALPTAVRGSYRNQVTVTGDGQTPNLSGCSGSAVDNCSQTSVTPKNPRLTFVKSVALNSQPPADDPNGDGQVQVGDRLTYTFTLNNRGDVPLAALALVDPLLDPGTLACAAKTGQGKPFSLGGAAITLGVNDSVTCSGKHTATLAEGASGLAENSAIVSGRAPDGTPWQATAGGIWRNALESAQLSLAKTAIHRDANGNGRFDQGETVAYTYLVRNVGTVTLSALNVVDSNPLFPVVTCAPRTLTTGASATCTAPDYVLSLADEAAGQVINSATATATDTQGQTAEAKDIRNVASGQSAGLAIKTSAVLSIDADRDDALTPGDTLTYTQIATNTGATPLARTTISDTLLGKAIGAKGACAPQQGATLNPGQQMVCTAKWVLQNSTTHRLENNASASARPVGRFAPVDAAASQVVPFTPPTEAPPVHTIGDYVWLDANNDGVQQASETGIDGVNLRLQTYATNQWRPASYADGSLIPDQITANGGFYRFANVPKASGQPYRVQVLPSNFKATLEGTQALYGAISSTSVAASVLTDSRDQGVGAIPNATDGILSRSFDLTAPTPANLNSIDFGFVRQTIAAPPDLQIVASVASGSVARGGRTTLTLNASNEVGSGNLSRAPVVIARLPTGLTVAATATTLPATNWSCQIATARQTVTCSYKGSLPLTGGADIGGPIVIPVAVAATAPAGTANIAATITKLTGEPSYANNTANLTVTVQ